MAIEILLAVMLAGTPVTVTTLDGKTVEGELASLSDRTLEVTTREGDETIPRENLMLVEFANVEAAPGEAAVIPVTLADQSRMTANKLIADGTTATLTLSSVGDVNVPFRQLRDVLFSPLDDKVAAGWKDLTERNTRDDLLVFRKGDVLDYVAGSVSKVTDETVTLLVRDRELAAPRDRVFGIILAVRSDTGRSTAASLRTIGGDELKARSLNLKEGGLVVTITGDLELVVPLEQVRLIDFGGGRIRFLADLPFDPSGSRSPDEDFPVVWFVSKNSPAGTGGMAPLTIGGQEYRRGLWLHSGAALRFRLNREFQKLRMTAGFDLTHVTRMPQFDPKVKLVITGDDKQLYAREFHWRDSPEPLDLDIADVRELVIRIEPLGAGLGILEHFALGDAQVIQ